jgi:hypothetical protein
VQLVKGQKDFEAAGAKIIAAADQNATQAISTTLEIKNKLQEEGDTTTELHITRRERQTYTRANSGKRARPEGDRDME